MYLSALSLALNRPGAVSLEQVVASLFAAGEQGAWYDPSAANVTWRRNLLTHTEQFDNAAWTKTGIKAFGSGSTANAIVAPDGTTTADLITQDASTGQHKAQAATQTLPSTGEPFVVSCYAKAGTATRICLYTYGTSKGLGVDLSTGQQFTVVGLTNVLPANVFIQAVPNYAGWYRIGFKDVVVGSFSVAVFIVGGSNNENFSYTGDDSSGLYVWGTQLERGEAATAYQRIVTPEITYLADVQSQPLLFTDSTGAAPVTGVEQPVGLILDKRKGLVLGSELVSNGDFSNGLTGWTAYSSTLAVVNGKQEVTIASSSGNGLQLLTTVVGAWYKVTGTLANIDSATGASLVAQNGTSFAFIAESAKITSTTSTEVVLYFAAQTTGTYILTRVTGSVGQKATFDNISVKLLDGNHAYQTGSTARPVLRARYNLLEYSEQLDQGTWVKNGITNSGADSNAIVAPDGTTTAERLKNLATISNHDAYRGVSTSATTYTFSAYLKADGVNWACLIFQTPDGTNRGCFFDLANGVKGTAFNSAVGDITPVAGAAGWYRCMVTATAAGAGTSYCLICVATADGNARPQYAGLTSQSIFAWGADLRVGTSAGDYQRIAAATDYATTSTITGQPFRPYIAFDGSDDCLFTASVDYSSSDEMLVALALNKLSDATTAIVAELSATSASNNGSWTVLAPSNNGLNSYRFQSKGTSLVEPGFGAFAPAPDKCVLVGQADISADSATIRRNKALVDTSTGDQGTGNYGNYPMYFGRRGGTSNPFTGQMYGVVIRGKTCTAGEVAAVETYLAEKAGLTL